MSTRRIIGALAIAAVAAMAILALPDLASACPACKETVRGSAQGAALSAGFNYTIFLLIGMVFGLFGTIAGIVVRAYRRTVG
jgi:hypothetical protein